MTLVVPFDGSELSQSALVRATALADAFDEDILALTIIPKSDAEYAREHGWLGPEESFDPATIVGRLETQVAEIAPDTDFQYEVVGRYASAGTIAKKLRKTAKEADASLVVIGSDNAGHMVTSIHSVGSTVAADETFDVLIVRQMMAPDSPASESAYW